MNILRRRFPYRKYNIVFILIGINIAVFLFEKLFGYRVWQYLSMNPYGVLDGKIWQFFTYMFVHDPRNYAHLLFNMFGLFIFGTRSEDALGSHEFLLYYLLTGALAGVFSFGLYIFTGQYYVLLMGASGALFAVMLAYAVLFPRSIIYLWGIIPLKAPVLILGYAAIEIVLMRTNRGGNVAHFTHLAGFAMGWLYFVVRFGINPWKEMRRK